MTKEAEGREGWEGGRGEGTAALPNRLAPPAPTPLALPPPLLIHRTPGYTHERYREIINSIRRYMPDASVSGDVIVGFPGETEEQFQRTVAMVEEVGFDRVNTGGCRAGQGRALTGWVQGLE